MKENKPILFINSAVTDNIKQKTQVMYDSRSKKKTEVKKPKTDETKSEIINVEVNNIENEVEYTEEMIQEENQNIVEETIDTQPVVERQFSNKIRLLNRRAELERYVLVLIKTNNNEIEGLFKGVNDNSIKLEIENNEEINILIDDIEEITILRV